MVLISVTPSYQKNHIEFSGMEFHRHRIKGVNQQKNSKYLRYFGKSLLQKSLQTTFDYSKFVCFMFIFDQKYTPKWLFCIAIGNAIGHYLSLTLPIVHPFEVTRSQNSKLAFIVYKNITFCKVYFNDEMTTKKL